MASFLFIEGDGGGGDGMGEKIPKVTWRSEFRKIGVWGIMSEVQRVVRVKGKLERLGKFLSR